MSTCSAKCGDKADKAYDKCRSTGQSHDVCAQVASTTYDKCVRDSEPSDKSWGDMTVGRGGRMRVTSRCGDKF